MDELERRAGAWHRLIWALVVLGAVLRVVRYAADRSLWGDEGALALNLIGKPLGDLLGALDFQQGAPTGFVVAEKAAVGVFGEGELALRLVPLLCGLAALPLFLLLVRRVLSPVGAVVAMALFALSDPLVYYASEVKQYESDVMVATAMALAAVAIDWRRVTWPSGVAIAIGGGLAGWLSHPALIVLAAVAAALLADALLERGRELRVLVALTAVWGASGIAALAVNRANAEDVAAAALESEGSGASRLQPVSDAWDTYGDVVGVANTATALAAVASLAGFLAVWSRSRRVALVLVAPLVLAVAVSLLGLYPSSSRFFLFLAPFLVAFVGEGAAGLLRMLPARPSGRLVGTAAVALLLLYPAAVAADNLLDPPGHEEVRTVLRHVDAGWRQGDALFVWYQSQYPLRYYELCDDCEVLGPGVRSVLYPPDPFDAPGVSAAATRAPSFYVSDPGSHALEALAGDLAPLVGKPRVWLLFSSTWDDGFVRQQLDCLGRRLDEARAPRAVAYLYDLSRAPARRSCLRAS